MDVVSRVADVACGAPYRFGNTTSGRMILDKGGDYACYVHMEQIGGNSIGSAVEALRLHKAEALLDLLNSLPVILEALRGVAAQSNVGTLEASRLGAKRIGTAQSVTQRLLGGER